MRYAILSLLLCLSLNLFGQDNAYRAALQKMFEVSGTKETYNSAIKQMMTMMKGQYANVDENVWNDLEKEFLKTSITDLVDMLVPVYQKYLTQGDLEKMIEFYSTPVGQKYAKSTPLITQESMQAGQQWGMKIAQQFQQKMKEKGY